MKTGFKILGIVLYGMLLLAFLAACGGSDDGTGETIPSFPYTGETGQAVINATNAAALVNGLYHNAQTGFMIMEGAGPAMGYPGGTVGDPCGSGNSTNTLEIDYVNLTIDGTVTFDNYNLCPAILNGTITLSAGFNGSLTLTMSSLSLTGSPADMAMAGRFAVTTPDGGDTMNITQNFWFDTGGEVSKIVNFKMKMDGTVSPGEITISSGDFYEPSVGYVSVATKAGDPMLDYGNGPEDGILVISGADNSVAELQFTGLNTAELWVDDGGGVFQYITTLNL